MLKIEDVFSDLPQLETNSLILRKITLDDAQDMFAYASDPEVSHHTTWDSHKTIDDSTHFLKMVSQSYANQEVAPWGMVYKENNQFIGTCGYGRWLPQHHRAEIEVSR
jgi:ribosomal-protein-alanine N-acetyltransferase